MPRMVSTVANVDCFVIHDGMTIPATTYKSEMIRLRGEARRRLLNSPPGWLPRRESDPNYVERRCMKLIHTQYGRICWHCNKEITIVYDIEPLRRKTDRAMSHKWFHYACWRHSQIVATNKRRRLTYKGKRDTQLALEGPQPILPPADGYEPQPILPQLILPAADGYEPQPMLPQPILPPADGYEPQPAAAGPAAEVPAAEGPAADVRRHPPLQE